MKTMLVTEATPKNGVVDAFISPVAELFSSVLEEPVSVRQTLCILHVMLAGFVAVFSIAVPLLFRALAIAWLWAALIQCKRAGLGHD